MRSRNRDIDLVILLVQVAALLGILVVLHPGVRQGLQGYAMVFLCLLVCMMLSAVLLIAIRERLTFREPAQNASRASGKIPSEPCTSVASGFLDASDEWISQLRGIGQFPFENLIAATFRRFGYGVTHPKSPEWTSGIDFIIEKGGCRRAIWCARGDTARVGVQTVRDFIGALAEAGVEKGTLISLESCTKQARRLAAEHEVRLLSGRQLGNVLSRAGSLEDLEIRELVRDQRRPTGCDDAAGASLGREEWSASGVYCSPPGSRDSLMT